MIGGCGYCNNKSAAGCEHCNPYQSMTQLPANGWWDVAEIRRERIEELEDELKKTVPTKYHDDIVDQWHQENVQLLDLNRKQKIIINSYAKLLEMENND